MITHARVGPSMRKLVRATVIAVICCATGVGMLRVLGGPGSPAGGQPDQSSSRYVNSAGVELPPDAAPPSEQYIRLFQLDNTYMEWFRTIYKGTYGHRIIAEPLIASIRTST